MSTEVHGQANLDVCCDGLFAAFTFEDIRLASPPAKKGVYVIRVRQTGAPVDEVLRRAAAAAQRLDWPLVGNKIASRTARLRRITQCPVIYIGSAGTRKTSKHTLKGRYGDFAGRHTVMFALWALLFWGWKLDYGWIQTDDPGAAEASLKNEYRRRHNGQLPALVAR
jgi:hypothetical protein